MNSLLSEGIRKMPKIPTKNNFRFFLIEYLKKDFNLRI